MGIEIKNTVAVTLFLVGTGCAVLGGLLLNQMPSSDSNANKAAIGVTFFGGLALATISFGYLCFNNFHRLPCSNPCGQFLFRLMGREPAGGEEAPLLPKALSPVTKA